MSDMGSHASSRLQAAPLVLTGAALGLMLAVGRDRVAPTAMALWLEPFWLVFGVYGALVLATSGRLRAAAGAVLGLTLLLVGARVPLDHAPAAAHAPEWANALRGCALLPDPVRSPVRLMLWTVDPQHPPSMDNAMLEAHPDLVLVTGSSDTSLAASLQGAMGGEAITIVGPTPESGMILAVRGAFQYCGGEDDHWVLDQPGDGDGSRIALAFPEIADVGVIPFVAVKLAGPGGPGGWLGWPDRLAEATASIAGLADTLGARRMVVAGDLHTPRTFRALAGGLLQAGLLSMPAPPNWPATLPGGLPGLSLHPLDQVWAGAAWSSSGSRTLDARGQRRAPVLVDLSPNSGVAGG